MGEAGKKQVTARPPWLIASTIPDDITARFDTADKLSDDDRKAILAIATTALAPFLPRAEPKK